MKSPTSPFDEPRNYLLSSDPEEVASLAGVIYSPGVFEIPFMRWTFRLTYPGLEFQMPRFLETFTIKLLTMLYLYRSKGVLLANQWVPYRELPDGLFYAKSFNETVESRVKDRFGDDLEGLARAAEQLGGRRVDQGDLGLVLQVYPRISLLFILWRGDEEFPASANILFDAHATSYLNVFELRMLSGEVVSRLVNLADGRLKLE
jgi:hypothetical protein